MGAQEHIFLILLVVFLYCYHFRGLGAHIRGVRAELDQLRDSTRERIKQRLAENEFQSRLQAVIPEPRRRLRVSGFWLICVLVVLYAGLLVWTLKTET